MSEDAFLTGHTIELRLPREEDVASGSWHQWYNDPITTRHNSHGVFPVTREQEAEYVRSAMSRPDTLLLAIVEKNSKRLVGNAALQNIDFMSRRCNIAITIGESTEFSAGVEVFGLLTEHAFSRMNLNRVADATHEQLISFVRMLGVLGFEIEGRGRQHFLRDGAFSDSIQFGVLASDFFRLRKERGGAILFPTLAELQQAIVATQRSASNT